jgi:aryl-alcohol dehydrogenase-like predicted oxidoreductase
LVASYVMAGGVLTGKYDSGEDGRATGQLDDPQLVAARELGRRVRAVAADTAVSPAALAIAFALANPATASVLFGATSPAQIAENVAALDVDAATVQRIAG